MPYFEKERQGPYFPWMNHALMGVILGCFAYELTLGPAFQSFLMTHGWVPAQFSLALTQGQFPFSPSLVICIFLHGGWLHLIGNLLCLFLLGNVVEERLGAVRYLVLYLCGSIIALLTQAAIAPFSSAPMIGSSGAISAVAGVYCLLFFSTQAPAQEPDDTAPPSPWPLEGTPTILFLIGWFFFHLVVGVYAYTIEETPLLLTRIAWGAHIGGFLGGTALGSLLLSSPERHRRRPTVGASPLVFDRPKSLPRRRSERGEFFS